MAEQAGNTRELQIRLGFSSKKVDEVKKKAKAVRKTVNKADVRVKAVKVKADRLDAQVKATQKMIAEGFMRMVIVQGLSETAEALIPQSDIAAFQSFRNLGINFTMNSLMLKSVRGGAITAMSTMALELTAKAVEAAKVRMDVMTKKLEELERVQGVNTRELVDFQKLVQSTQDIRIQKIVDRLYKEHRRRAG